MSIRRRQNGAIDRHCVGRLRQSGRSKRSRWSATILRESVIGEEY